MNGGRTHVEIAVSVEYSREWGRKVCEGIAAYAQMRPGWHLSMFKVGLPDSADMRRFDGFLWGIPDERTARALKATGRPVVDLFGLDVSIGGITGVGVDHESCGKLAAQTFISHQFRNFAYLGWKDLPLSRRRQLPYERELEQSGHNCRSYLSRACVTASSISDATSAGRKAADFQSTLGRLANMRRYLMVAVAVLAVDGIAKTINVANGEELAAAVKSVKEVRAANRDVPVEILLASGDYDVPERLVMREGFGFLSSDVAPVTIRAAPGAKPRLRGGRVVKGWKRTSFNGRNDVWVADVAALNLKAQLPLFFYDGVSMALCRRPNADPSRPYSGGWAYVPGKAVNMYKDIEGARDDEVPVRPEDWVDRARIDEGRICIFPRYNWWNKVLPVASCDPTNHTLRLAQGIGKTFDPRANDRYHLMGYREDLDAPGEWYHDLAGAKVYFISPDGSNPNAKRTAVVADESLSMFRLECVTNVVIKGLEICEASSAVKILRSDRCEVVACRLHDIGFFSGKAVEIYGTRCAVRDCDIWNIGSYGISVSGFWNTRYAPDTRDGNVVENNYIHHTGLVNRHGFGVYVAGQGSRVSRNLIHDMPRGGIFYSGRFLTIDRNRIRHVNLEMEDTAAIYGGGFMNNTGTRIVDNWVSHSIGFSHNKEGVYSFRKTQAWGIYLDDCSGGAVVAGNLVNHCNGGAMHMHCARFNVVSNNVFVANGGKSANPRQFSIRGWKTTDKGRLAEHLRTNEQKSYERLLSVSPSWTNYPALSYPPNNPDAPGGYIMQGNRIVNNIWYYPNQPDSFLYTPGNYNVSNNVFDANIIWDGSGTVKITHEGKNITLEQWRAMGQERSSVLADPLFKDPKHGDWSFREGSPALALGIAPIHPEKAGLYVNENRKALPKEAEGAREHPEWVSNPR